MIPKVCLLNFLISPHVLDSYRPAKKMVDLAKELASKSPLIKELHRYLSKVKKQRPPPRMKSRDAVFYTYFPITAVSI